MDQSTVWLRFSTNETGDKYYQVQALLTDLSLEAPDNDNMSFLRIVQDGWITTGSNIDIVWLLK